MQGTFTGVGVGPGDPELITLKAIRVIKESSVIAIPVSDITLTEPVRMTEDMGGAKSSSAEYLEKCVAYGIALKAIPEIAGKEKLFLPMPMIREKEKLKKIHDLDTEAIEALLKEKIDVAFLTLGDPAVYSTCMYVHKRLKERGFCTRLVPGIPSFCAAAARLDISLVENRQELHILPASYQIEEGMGLTGTKVLMKAGRKLPEVKKILRQKNCGAGMVENCGMEEEKIYLSAEEIPEEAGYYSLIIVKDKKKEKEKKAEEERR